METFEGLRGRQFLRTEGKEICQLKEWRRGLGCNVGKYLAYDKGARRLERGRMKLSRNRGGIGRFCHGRRKST